ncbi:tetratricopeptide repeat protein [Candidatus Odyssella thessalonicensis]|uniref:tetratricopeptide repeat protein n=1 Tax=Candidatus Odyssella thessalonicensis TaxID=84647 RepID=UPI000225C09C|nr:tetratricopeptide repeat protein [Candidatus Odyssella thessalonicensis]
MTKLLCKIYYNTASIFALSFSLAAAMDVGPHQETKKETDYQTETAATPKVISSLAKAGVEPIKAQESQDAPTALSDAKGHRDINNLSMEDLQTEAAAGNPEAQLNLAKCYEKGKGIPVDFNTAFMWYHQAAAQGYAPAQYKIGYFYWEGKYIAKSYEKAIEWFFKAAQKGYANALCLLGMAHWLGKGVERNEKKAIEFLTQAAAQGHKEAQYNLGVTYYECKDLPRDEKKAVDYWLKAAAQGFAGAQRCLGTCHMRGSGVAKDESKAIEYWCKAAIQEDSRAKKKITLHLGKLQNIAATPIGTAQPILEILHQLALTLKDKKDAGLISNKECYILEQVNNLESIILQEKMATFATELSEIILAFNSPGFMVKFSNPKKIADFTEMNSEREIQRYSRLDDLVCWGQNAVKIADLLHQKLFEENKKDSLSFAQMEDLIADRLNIISQSITSLRVVRETVNALIKSYKPDRNDEEFQQEQKRDRGELIKSYRGEDEIIATTLENILLFEAPSGSRNSILRYYVDRLISINRALEEQQVTYKFFKTQSNTINFLKSQLLAILKQGVNERNNRLKDLCPWLA